MEAHRIEKKDPVFCSVKRNCRGVSKRSACNEPDLHVLACINGVAKARRQKSTYGYIGVSNTHVDSEQNRHAPVTVAGLTAILIKTTGPTRIESGDTVVLGVGSRGSHHPRIE